MARFCAQCGARLDDGARFCSKCGAEAKDAPSGASIPEGDGVDEALRSLGGVADAKEPRGASDETMVVGPEATAVSHGFREGFPAWGRAAWLSRVAKLGHAPLRHERGLGPLRRAAAHRPQRDLRAPWPRLQGRVAPRVLPEQVLVPRALLCRLIDHKAWRSGNSDTSPEFASCLANYQDHRTHG